MKFNETKIGDFVYCFDAQICELSTKKIIGMSAVRFDGVSRDMVIDITIDGYPTPFVCNANAEMVMANGNLLTITPNKDKALTAIETYKNNLGNIIANIDNIKSNYDKCEKTLLENNPTLKQQQESSAKIKALETEISSVKTELTDVKSVLHEIKAMLQ